MPALRALGWGLNTASESRMQIYAVPPFCQVLFFFFNSAVRKKDSGTFWRRVGVYVRKRRGRERDGERRSALGTLGLYTDAAGHSYRSALMGQI